MSSEHPPPNERFVRLISQHEREIRRYVATLLPDRSAADDVMQETSIAMWKKCDEYREDLPFTNWACRFAYYEVLRHRKRQQVQRRYFCQATLESLAEERLDEQEYLVDRRGALDDCLSNLPQSDQDLVGLRYATDVSVSQMARDIDQPAKALYRALERIRRVLLNCVTQRLAAE